MDVKELPASITELELFSGLDPPQIAMFLQRCRKLMVTAGQSLMKAGEHADSCYLIIRGKVDVRARSRGQVVSIATLEGGQLVGEMGLFRDKPYRMADAITIKDSLVVQIPYDYLHRLEGLHHEIAINLKANLQQIAQSRLLGVAALDPEAWRPPSKPDAKPNSARAALEERVAAAGQPPDPRLERPHPPDTSAATPEPPLLVPIQIKVALARTPLFQGFGQDDLDRLLPVVSLLRYQAGDAVVLAGDAADCLFVIALGRLDVVIEADGEAHPVAQLGPGQCVGEIAFAQGTHVRAASVLAGTASTLLRMGYDDLDRATSWRARTLAAFRANLDRLVAERA